MILLEEEVGELKCCAVGERRVVVWWWVVPRMTRLEKSDSSMKANSLNPAVTLLILFYHSRAGNQLIELRSSLSIRLEDDDGRK